MIHPGPADQSPLERRLAFRERLRTEFYVTTFFIPVKTVAAVVGMSPSTLYGYIRDGLFFLPYRRINKTPMVAVDDLVAWICSDASVLSPIAPGPIRAPESTSAPGLAEGRQPEPPCQREKKTESPFDQIVERTLKEMGLEQNKRRAPRR